MHPRPPVSPRRSPTRRLPRSSAPWWPASGYRPAGSYSVELLEDPRLAGDKVREEASKVVKAAASESEERMGEESDDLVYHLAVLLLSRGISMAEVLQVLNGRRRPR